VAAPAAAAAASDNAVYTVTVEGQSYVVQVAEGGDIGAIQPVAAASPSPAPVAVASGAGQPLHAPLAGNIVRVMVNEGDTVAAGDLVLILEAMKMETEVRAQTGGAVHGIAVREGDAVAVGDTLMSIG
jgi:oxaloacetate decarboxylase alpha subunit